MLRPLHDAFLFCFFNDTAEGRFIERSAGRIILTNQTMDHQGQEARWAKVLAIGNDVVDFKVGDIVLIEAGKWTIGFKHDEMKIWKSDQKQVIAIGEDESVTYSYRF